MVLLAVGLVLELGFFCIYHAFNFIKVTDKKLCFIITFLASLRDISVFNRPGVAGAVLQTPPSLIHSLID